MRLRHRMVVAAAFGIVLLGGACAPKSPDPAVWTDQARHAVTGVQGEVATMQLVLRQQQADKLPQNYQQVVAVDSEEAVGTTTESFTSVQPPSGEDEQYAEISSVLSDASDVVTDVRIAIVREDTRAYPKLLRELTKVSDDLSKALEGLNPR